MLFHFHTLIIPSQDAVTRKHWDAIHDVISSIDPTCPGAGWSVAHGGSSSPVITVLLDFVQTSCTTFVPSTNLHLNH